MTSRKASRGPAGTSLDIMLQRYAQKTPTAWQNPGVNLVQLRFADALVPQAATLQQSLSIQTWQHW